MRELKTLPAYVESLSEHINNNSEAQKRFMLLVASALPHIDHLVADIMAQWNYNNEQINNELNIALKKLKELETKEIK
jgi:hypothetical protein